jgi:hypothetical protein
MTTRHVLDFSMDVETPSSACCECGKRLNGAAGPREPRPGDLLLCIGCGSLNVFGEDLRLRRPTDDEMFEAARTSSVQEVRRIILAMQSNRTAKRKNSGEDLL